MTLEEGIALRNKMFADPELLALYDKADEVSGSMTKHGRQHAFDVPAFGKQLAEAIERHFPGLISPMEREVLAPMAQFMHDIGRCVNLVHKDKHLGTRHHAAFSAGICWQWLERNAPEMPRALKLVIVRAVRMHQAEYCLQPRDIVDNVHALVVIADKCVGDSERVRGAKARRLKLLRLFWLNRWDWNRSFPHNQDWLNNIANFAIKRARVDVDPGDQPEPRYRGAIILKLDVDEKIATLKQIMSVDWFAEAFHAVARSCQFLGFVFRIEVNGKRCRWDDGAHGWMEMASIPVPRS